MGGRQREEGEAGLVQGQACLRIFLLQETWACIVPLTWTAWAWWPGTDRHCAGLDTTQEAGEE